MTAPLMTAAPLTEVLDFRELLINLRCFTHTYGIDHDIVLKAEDECDAAYRRAISEVEASETELRITKQSLRESNAEVERVTKELRHVAEYHAEIDDKGRIHFGGAVGSGPVVQAQYPFIRANAPAVRGDAAIREDAPRSCNRHKDCDAADRKARETGRTYADHCHDSCCEDCFGN